MNDKFDELAKGMDQSVTRRAALKKFGLALAGFALALLGMANNAHATRGGKLNCKKVRAACGNCVAPFGCADENCYNSCWGACLTCEPGCC